MLMYTRQLANRNVILDNIFFKKRLLKKFLLLLFILIIRSVHLFPVSAYFSRFFPDLQVLKVPVILFRVILVNVLVEFFEVLHL
jgi:hypothetical protein